MIKYDDEGILCFQTAEEITEDHFDAGVSTIGWYFQKEDYTLEGPFASEQECRDAMDQYFLG